MKKEIKKWVSRILITLLILAAGLVLYSVTVYRGSYPDYSTYNTTGAGAKALYLLAGKMGYRVNRYHYPAKFLDEESVMVFYRPDYGLFNADQEQESLKTWLLKGNTMILIPDTESMNQLWIFELISELKKTHEQIHIGDITITKYTLDNGSVYVMDQPDSFMNSQLSESDGALAFIRTLERINKPEIFFNEYYRFMQKAAPGVWELIGTTGQIIAIQLLLAVVLTVIRGWKPFGRVRNERQWTKRPENEMVKALSALYLRMQAYPLVLSNYYGYFEQKYRRFLSTPGPMQEKTKKTMAACGRYIEENRKSKKELIRLVRNLEKVEDEMNRRRT